MAKDKPSKAQAEISPQTLCWRASAPIAPLLSNSAELGQCLDFLAKMIAEAPAAEGHFLELLKIIDNIWQEPAGGESQHKHIRAEAAATRAYVRRKVYALLLQKETLAYTADPFAGWGIPCYLEDEAALSLEKKTADKLEGKAIKALLSRLMNMGEGRAKDDLFAALGDYASMLWRAWLNTTDYRQPDEINWALLRAAYERELAELHSSVYAFTTDEF